MKKFITMMIMVFAVAVAMAQAPEKFSYQAVVRNASNALVTNAPVSVRVSILQGSVTGNLVYVETHTVPTNANGLLTLDIGGGTVQQGIFTNIDWANGPYFLKTETDPNGGNNYSITSVQQLLSVPYALYAKDAGNIPTVPANVSAFTNDAGYITAQDIPEIPTVPTNVSAFVNDVPYMTSFTEQQILTISNDTIFLTGGSFVKLPEGFNGDYNSLTNTPSIPTVPTNVSAFVNDMGYLTSFTEQQVLSISNDTIFLTGGSFVKLPEGFDGDYNSLTNTPAIPTVPTDVSVFNNDANYVSNTECADVDLCALAALVSGLQGQLTELQGQLAELQSTIDSLTVPDTTVTPIATLPTVITSAVSNITETTATSGGEVTADGGAAVTVRGVCWSTSATPTIADNHTSDGAGLGTFTSNITGLTTSTTYYVRAYATNSVGTAYGETVTFTTNFIVQSCPPIVTDIDGNTYYTVQIGGQCWMRENLRTSKLMDGTSIPFGSNAQNDTDPCYYYLNNDMYSLPLVTRGYSYNWSAALMVCPIGWHLPSDAEWTILTNYLGSQNEYICDENSDYIAKALASTEGWGSWANGECFPGDQSVYANNASGFGAVPTGAYEPLFNQGYFDWHAYFWSATEYETNTAYYRFLISNSADVGRHYSDKSNGFSVRCLRDESGTDTIQATLPTVITSTVSGIMETTATCGGEVTADGGATVTARGVCWSTSATPTIADAHTADGMGMGTFTSNITDLTANTTYYVRAYATNSVGTVYGETETFTTEATTPIVHVQPCSGTPTVTDHEGNVYHTMQIGSQCWMQENLRTTTSPSTGTYLIPSAGTGSTYTGKQAFWYNNEATYVPTSYGLLYNWNAAVDTFNTVYGETSVDNDYTHAEWVSFTGYRQGICPAGWHLPSDAEWTAMTDYVGNQRENACGGYSNFIAKALASETGWNNCYSGDCLPGDQIVHANNATGFSAVPAGSCNGSSFGGAGYRTSYWSSTQSDYSSSSAQSRDLGCDFATVARNSASKCYGLSVRCIRDADGTFATLPTVITDTVSEVTETTVTCSGEVSADGGAEVTERGMYWSEGSIPNINGSHVTNGNGMGTFATSIASLTPGTTYYVCAYAINSVGISYGEVVSFTTAGSAPNPIEVDEKSCPNTPTVTDIDGNSYGTVQIGDQCWMRENLRTTHYADSTAIPAGGDVTSYTDPYYYDYNSYGIPLQKRGYIYNWPAATHSASFVNVNTYRIQGVCPSGWHLPSNAEWTQLMNYMKNQAEYTCGGNTNDISKALASTEWWNVYSGECIPGDQSVHPNNASGFSAVPAGRRASSKFYEAGYSAGFWSSSWEGGYGAGDSYLLYYNETYVRSYNNLELPAWSVRCLRGGAHPTVITDTVSEVTETTAICGGEVTTDGGAEVIEYGVCWGTSATPTITDAHISIGTGTGTFTCNITGLTPGLTYYFRAYAINSVGTAYGEVVSFTTNSFNGQPCLGMPTVTDVDGNVYNTVQIGNQCWMKENMRSTHCSDGTTVPAGGNVSSYTNPYYYSNPELDAAIHGYLYNWSAAMIVCPTGWHLPSEVEWTQLTSYVNSVPDYQCGNGYGYGRIAKALASTFDWCISTTACAIGNDLSANNATGFQAVPAGYFAEDEYFSSWESDAFFWSSTEYYTDYARYINLHCWSANVSFDYYTTDPKELGYSVRCLRDEGGTDTTQTTLPTVITSAVSGIMETTAICGGNVTSDGGAAVTERGVCWSTSTLPTVTDNHTTDGAGLSTFTSNITNLTPSTTYYVRAYAINSVGTAYGETVTFATLSAGGGAVVDEKSCPAAPTVTDYDDNVYATVLIGNQCWMRENLRTTHYADGTAILAGGSNTSDTQPYYYDYSTHSLPLGTRGYLYNWSAAMVACPAGWHLPSDAEWTQLTDYVGSQTEYTCGGDNDYIAKALASETGWESSTNTCAVGNDPTSNNATGFSAVPAGLCYGSSFSFAGSYAAFWSSTQNASNRAYYRDLDCYDADVYRSGNGNEYYGYSVRCLRD